MRIIARMNVGGPAVQVSGLMRGFNSKGFDHRLYAGFCAADEADYLDTVATDVQATRIAGFGRRVSLGGDLKAFIALVKEIRSFKPHIIHTHTAKAGFLGRIASIVSLQPSIRVHTFHGHLLNGYFGAIKRRLVIIAEKVLAIFTHELLAVGDKVRQDLLAVGIGNLSKFGLMPPGLELGRLPDKKESQKSYGLSTATLHSAFIGRVTQIKRPDRFLDVVSEIKKREVRLEFFMAGDGELLDICRERIARENLPVKVLGWQSDIEKVLSAADLVVLTSDNEGTPLSLIQAGMAGLPVVTTRVGSVPEVVLDGTTGIVTNLDVQEFADALEKLANNSELRGSMGAAAKEFTLANFGVKRLVHDHEELYKKLLANRAKS
ncbi:MAG: glycosyltransferase family 1 protein [Streptomycetaceae bacterium]|nr:MAG: glycosyltransferase family 1 protein [Streptomycetaceae bacterium]